jgi:hypothetical protein
MTGGLGRLPREQEPAQSRYYVKHIFEGFVPPPG